MNWRRLAGGILAVVGVWGAAAGIRLMVRAWTADTARGPQYWENVYGPLMAGGAVVAAAGLWFVFKKQRP
ncbi:MAG: hypothetical protein IH851_11880 [Armatimonadetes bacterium]|nr:hypothetical protein [Armatimonadota bacterium]